MSIPVLHLRGTPYEMGSAHGAAFRDAIRHFADERVQLAGDPYWSGREVPREAVLALAERCLEAHRAYAPELVEELAGMADATGLSLAELVVVGGFTDFTDTVYAATAEGAEGAAGAEGDVPPAAPRGTPAGADNCTAFLVPGGRTADGRGLFGQTWDMHESGAEQVLLIRGEPEGGVPFLAFSSAGCVGMIGLNAYGIAIGINNLMGADGRVGVTWPFVIRKALQQRTLDAALACVLEAPLAGAHNYLLMDADGRGANVEAMGGRRPLTRLRAEPLVHTNHCLLPDSRALERARAPSSQAASEARLARAQELLADGAVDVERLMEVTRDPQAICVPGGPAHNHVASCGAALMRPATREFWAVKGLPSENAYERFTLTAPAEA